MVELGETELMELAVAVRLALALGLKKDEAVGLTDGEWDGRTLEETVALALELRLAKVDTDAAGEVERRPEVLAEADALVLTLTAFEALSEAETLGLLLGAGEMLTEAEMRGLSLGAGEALAERVCETEEVPLVDGERVELPPEVAVAVAAGEPEGDGEGVLLDEGEAVPPMLGLEDAFAVAKAVLDAAVDEEALALQLSERVAEMASLDPLTVAAPDDERLGDAEVDIELDAVDAAEPLDWAEPDALADALVDTVEDGAGGGDALSETEILTEASGDAAGEANCEAEDVAELDAEPDNAAEPVGKGDGKTDSPRVPLGDGDAASDGNAVAVSDRDPAADRDLEALAATLREAEVELGAPAEGDGEGVASGTGDQSTSGATPRMALAGDALVPAAPLMSANGADNAAAAAAPLEYMLELSAASAAAPHAPVVSTQATPHVA